MKKLHRSHSQENGQGYYVVFKRLCENMGVEYSEFCRMADALGRDPLQLLKEAEQQKMPSAGTEGDETERK